MAAGGTAQGAIAGRGSTSATVACLMRSATFRPGTADTGAISGTWTTDAVAITIAGIAIIGMTTATTTVGTTTTPTTIQTIAIPTTIRIAIGVIADARKQDAGIGGPEMGPFSLARP